MSLRALLLASILALGACDLRPADFSRVERSAEQFHDTWTQRVSEVQATQQVQVARLEVLPPDTAGFEDARTQLATIGTSLDEVAKTKMPAVDAEIRLRVEQKQQYLAEQALRHGRQDFQSAITEARNSLDVQRVVLEELEKTAAAKKDEVAADGAVADIVNPAFARVKGSHSDVLGIAFKPDTAELDLAAQDTTAGLMRLIALASTCEGIRLELIAHTAKNGDAKINQRLSVAQAEAVQAHLVSSGVAPDKIARAIGVGGERPAAAEPDANSPEEQAMDIAELAKIRARNRRISVTVLEPCPAADPA